MKAKDFVSQFPSKFFDEEFEERKKLMKLTDDKLDIKKTQYKKIFYFDSLLKDLKELLIENSNFDLHTYEVERISFFIGQLRSILTWLNGLDFSNPGNYKKIFVGFDANLSSGGFSQNIEKKTNSGEIVGSVSILDEYIGELLNLLNLIKLKILNVEQIKDVKKNSVFLINNASKLTEAVEKAENWISVEEKAMATFLKKRAATFSHKAEEHKGIFVWLWFFVALIFGVIVMFFVIDFVEVLTKSPDVTLGAALLRLSGLIVPSYLAVFCIDQFMRHRKLHEAYKFRDIAMENMIELRKGSTDHKERDLILNKGLAVIFSEPVLKGDTGAKQIISELKDVLKGKIVASE